MSSDRTPYFRVDVDAGAGPILSVGPFPTREDARYAAVEFQARALKRLGEAALDKLDFCVEEAVGAPVVDHPTVDVAVRALRKLLS